MRLHSRLGVLAIFLGSISWALPAPAGSLEIYGSSGATNDPSGQEELLVNAATGPLSGRVSSAGSSASGGGGASALASGSAEYGRLAVQGGAIAFGPFAEFGGGIAVGGFVASWTDEFTIHATNPALMFQTGTFVFALSLSGTLLADAGLADFSNTRASYSVDVTSLSFCGPSCTTHRYGELDDFGIQGGGAFFQGDPIGDFRGTPVAFAFDIPLDLKVELGVGTQAVAGVQTDTSTASADLGSTLLWGGFLEVRDSQGNLVTDYTVTSNSGVDWSQPVSVPEPATAVIVAMGFLGLALRGALGPIEPTR